VLTEILGGMMHLQIIFASYIIVQFSLFSLFFYLSLKEKKFKYIPIAGALVFYVIAIRNFANAEFDSFSICWLQFFSSHIVFYCYMNRCVIPILHLSITTKNFGL